MATLDNYADSLAKLIGGIKHSQESYFDTKNIGIRLLFNCCMLYIFYNDLLQNLEIG